MEVSPGGWRFLTATAVALFVAAWFLPVILVPSFMPWTPPSAPTPYYGWHALNAAMEPLLTLARPDSVLDGLRRVIVVASGLSNALFVGAVVGLSLGSPRGGSARLEAALWLALSLNLVWLWEAPGALRGGYVLWVLSFPLLALAVRARRRAAACAPGGFQERAV